MAPSTVVRGIGALPVLTLLILAASLVLLLAHRASWRELVQAGQHDRALRAFEAAEAGRAWAQARLSDPRRIDAACQPSGIPTDRTWRDRLEPLGATASAACTARAAGTWVCHCPDQGRAVAPAPLDDADRPGFIVALGAGQQAGRWWLRVVGCADARHNCALDDEHAARAAQRELMVAWPLGRDRPDAALVSLGVARLAAGVVLDATAADGAGIALSSAEPPVLAEPVQLHSRPGRAASDAIRAPDGRWLDEAGEPWSAPRFQHRLFGLAEPALPTLPGIDRVACAADGCTSADLAPVIARGTRWIWVDGDLTIDAPVVGGSPQAPVLLRAGRLQVRAALDWVGWVHASALDWREAPAGQVRGTVTVSGTSELAGPVLLRHEPAVLARLASHSLPMLPLPGSWRDALDDDERP